MTKLEITKIVVGKVAAYGSGIIIYSIINNNLTDEQLPLHKKVSAAVGAVVIGGIVADAVHEHTGHMIDSFVEMYDKVTGKV